MASGRAQLLIAIASLLTAILFWAGNVVVGASAVETVDPLSLTLLRWALACVPLLLIAQLVERPDWRRLIRAWPWLLALSVTGMAGYPLFLYAALQFTDPFNAAIINSFNPAMIAIAAAFILRERLTVTSVVGILVALVGVLFVITRGDLAALLTGSFGLGDMLMILGGVVWVAYTILGRMGPRVPAISSTALQAVLAVIVLAPVSLATGGPTLPSTPDATWGLLFIAVFPSVLSYLLWNRALAVIPAARAGVFLNLMAVFTALILVFTGQPIALPQLVGGAVVLAGVAITNARAFLRAPPSAPPPPPAA